MRLSFGSELRQRGENGESLFASRCFASRSHIPWVWHEVFVETIFSFGCISKVRLALTMSQSFARAVCEGMGLFCMVIVVLRSLLLKIQILSGFLTLYHPSMQNFHIQYEFIDRKYDGLSD